MKMNRLNQHKIQSELT